VFPLLRFGDQGCRFNRPLIAPMLTDKQSGVSALDYRREVVAPDTPS